MANQKSSLSSSYNDQALSEEGNVDKIREILFGGQIRDFDRRFTEIEQRMSNMIESTVKKLEQDLVKRNTHIENKLDQLIDQLKDDQKASAEDWKENIDQIKTQLNLDLKQLESKIHQELHSAKVELREENKQTNQLMQSNTKQLKSDMERETNTLKASKAGKADIAAALQELALQFSGSAVITK